MQLEEILDYVNAALLAAGTLTMVFGAVGLIRMPDVYTRAQASSKASTLGLAFVFLAVALHFRELGAVVQAITVIGFAFFSIPIAAHMVVRAAHGTGTRPWPECLHDDLRDDED